MPLYAYKCECGHEIEMLLAVADRDKLFKCPKCPKRLRRVVTMATLGKPPHRTQAILAGGKKISGNWEK